MKINEFIENFKNARVQNSKVNPNAISEYFKDVLEVNAYVPFRQKRQIAEMIVEQNIEEVDGIKKYDSIGGYVSLIVASISAHTNLEWSEDPVADYDLLAESGLLPQIIAEFQGSHDEIDIILKMALDMELEDNNVNVLVGRFLNGILNKLDGVGEVLKDALGDFDISKLLGSDIKEEDLAQLKGFLDRLK